MNKLFNWILIFILGLYIIIPFDLIPDFIPIGGWIDDFGAFLLMLELLRENSKEVKT